MRASRAANEQQRSKRKVRNFLLQPLVQVRLGLYSILVAFLFSMAVVCILYINLGDFAEIVVALTDTESEVRELFATYMVQTKWWIMLIVLVFLLINVLISIVYTHRLVGPTIAFRNQLLRITAGDFSERVRLRRGDAFNEVADVLNQLTEQLAENDGKIMRHEPENRA